MDIHLCTCAYVDMKEPQWEGHNQFMEDTAATSEAAL
jgi:hypothetical protein